MGLFKLTGVLGLGNDLSQELGEVRDVLAQKAGLENKRLTGVVRNQLTS